MAKKNNQGYIQIHRTLLEKGWAKKPEFIALWLYILLKCTHSKQEYFWNGQTIDLQAGQFISGRKQIAIETGINESKVERILKVFESEQQIEQRKTSTSRLISINNWHKFQKSEQRFEQRVNNERTTSEQRVNTKQECNNDNNDNTNSNIVVEKNKFFPPTQNEVYDYLLTYKPNWDLNLVKNESEKFHDHFTSNGWLISGRSKMKDWKAAVRNWTKNYKKFNNDTKSTRSGERIGRMAKEDIEEFLSTPFKRIDIFSDKGDHQ